VERLALASFDSHQHVFDYLPDLDRIERLHHISDAELCAPAAVGVAGARGQEDDRDVSCPGVGRELARDLPAVEAGHHHVEQHEVWPLRTGELQCGRAVVGLQHLDSGGAEVDAAEQPDRALVVYDEHPACDAVRAVNVVRNLSFHSAEPVYAGRSGVKRSGTRIEAVAEAPKIGVLAVQGNVREHAAMLRELGAEPVEVRKPEQLSELDGLVIPGGETTAIMRLVRLHGLEEAIRAFDRPVLGTCAGMIMLDRSHLGLVDLEVARNAYGRQVASFEADLELAGAERPLRGVFIRAPRVVEAGPEVEVLAELDGEPVLLRQGRVIVASFHPELTGDTRVHERFLELVREESGVRA
jgi:5'-phosphate synthase pdxT subunit